MKRNCAKCIESSVIGLSLEALSVAVERFTAITEHYRDPSLGILGHDLRNPLTAIINGASLLIDSPSLDDRSVSIAARMLNSGIGAWSG
ncbi:MAG: hypothetical protein ACXWUG_20790 [Polyangiales bacterium]